MQGDKTPKPPPEQLHAAAPTQSSSGGSSSRSAVGGLVRKLSFGRKPPKPTAAASSSGTPPPSSGTPSFSEAAASPPKPATRKATDGGLSAALNRLQITVKDLRSDPSEQPHESVKLLGPLLLDDDDAVRSDALQALFRAGTLVDGPELRPHIVGLARGLTASDKKRRVEAAELLRIATDGRVAVTNASARAERAPSVVLDDAVRGGINEHSANNVAEFAEFRRKIPSEPPDGRGITILRAGFMSN